MNMEYCRNCINLTIEKDPPSRAMYYRCHHGRLTSLGLTRVSIYRLKRCPEDEIPILNEIRKHK